MQWDHPYIFDLFPAYDYRKPSRPWEIHCRDQDGIRNCAWQMKAFHYWWIIKQCLESGEVGLSMGIDGLPFCVQAQNEKDAGGHYFCDYGSVQKAFNPGQFPLIVASAAIPFLRCENGQARCAGLEVVKAIDSWGQLVKPGGFLVAAIMDETGPALQGRSLKDTSRFSHAWTARQFEAEILSKINGGIWDVHEFDTFKNGMSFDVVLIKK